MSRLIKHFIPLCGALTVALLPSLASAQECGADQPCPAGFECQTGVGDVACPAIACAEGEDCVQPECGMPEPYSYCAPKQCDPDGAADQCGAGMVCFSYESGMCSGSAGAAPACAPGEDCPAVEPVEPVEMCTTTVESYCTYKYNLPCEAAADCGAGFDCVPYEISSCAGSEPSMGGGEAAGTGGASGGGADPADGDAPVDDRAAPIMDPPECTTELSEEKYCQVIDVTCETAADCEEGWTCEDMGVAVGGCTMTPPDSTDPPVPEGTEPAPAMDGGAAPAEGEALIAPCDPAPMMAVEKKCAPPGYSYGYAYAADDGTVTTSAESGGDLGGNVGGTDDPTGAPSPMAPGAPGASGPGTGNTSTGTNANATTTNTDTGAGCSVGHSPSHSNAGFAGLLLGLAAFALRRKR